MNYQFIMFEEHLQSLQTKESFPKNFTIETAKNLEREFGRLIRIFKDMAIELNTKEKAKIYFNFHQQNLAILMDRASHEISLKQSSSHRKIIESSLGTLLEKMEAIMFWMEQVFPDIFNYNDKVPVKILQSQRAALQQSLHSVVAEIKRFGLSKDLSNLTEIILDASQISSYYDLEFWKNSLKKVTVRMQSAKSIDEFGVIKIYLEVGINHHALFDHTKLFISKEIENKTTLAEKISLVCFLRKEMRVLFTENPIFQFKNGPDIKKVIKRFLREELLLLRAMEFINHEVEEAGIMNANYKVSFSVKQLAFFVHLQMETGIIIWQRAKFAHQYIARHFSTIERDSISEKSARNAHYNHATEDIKKVIVKLSEMLALAQERY